jgi:membrane protease YdiL (CAAX protease family)
MATRRVFLLALLTQGVLIITAWALSHLLNIPPQWGEVPRDVLLGIAGALGLAVANYLLLLYAPPFWLVRGVRAVYHEVLVPLFSRLGATSIIVLGAVAGIGEEWLFRGVLQPLTGLLLASIVFGLAHVGTRSMLAFGLWASAMGLLLGVLAQATGGLMAPMVAHGVYDILALAYLRRGALNA